MKLHSNARWVVGVALLATCQLTYAKLTAEEAALLGQSLTPVGAEKAGNADGTIPAWTGGLIEPPAGFDPAKGHLDPYANEKPLFVITGENAEQYKDKLAPGQMALLKRYPTYKLAVYPSHRTAGFPQKVYDDIIKEAPAAELGNNGLAILNIQNTSVPFPIPKNGLEAIWNTSFRYRGDTVLRYVAEAPVQTNGAFTPVKREERIMYRYSLPADMNNTLSLYLTFYNSPSSVAGDGIILHEFIDLIKQPRAGWVYNPGRRRVLRAPEVSFDTPRSGTDGLSVVDEYGGFQGSPERYDWKLLGKKEMFISYNNFRLSDKSLKYKDILQAQTMNQDYIRYEPHRVWVVEATLKEGYSHVYAKRVFYLDEDSWQVAHSDAYDGRGELWRVQEQHAMQFYEASAFWASGSVFYDLQARRYVVSQLMNEEKPTLFNMPMRVSNFTSSALRRQGD